MSSCEGFGVRDGAWPGDCLVIAGAGFEAAVQDADEAVAELAEGGIVAQATRALPVIAGAGAGGGGQRGEGLGLQGVSEPVVADEPGQDGLTPARCTGDRAGPSVVFPGLGGSVAAGCVPELGEHPGAVDRPGAGLG